MLIKTYRIANFEIVISGIGEMLSLADDSHCSGDPGERCTPTEPAVFETGSDGSVAVRCSCGRCGRGINVKYVSNGEPQFNSINAHDIDKCESAGYHDMEELGTLIAAGGGSLVRTSECLRCNSCSVEHFDLA